MIKLGDKVTDSITGIAGTATARVEHLYGCRQICVSYAKDGELFDRYFDEQRLDKNSDAGPGGEQDPPPARSTPPTR